MLRLIAPAVKNPATVQNLENSASEPENVFLNTTSTPIKTKTTTSKTTPVNSRNKYSIPFLILENEKRDFEMR